MPKKYFDEENFLGENESREFGGNHSEKGEQRGEKEEKEKQLSRKSVLEVSEGALYLTPSGGRNRK